MPESPSFIPEATQPVWKGMSKPENRQMIHPALALYRYFDKSGDEKKIGLDLIKKMRPGDTARFLKRQDDHLKALESMGCHAHVPFPLTTETRLACGMGIATVAENGLLIDRVHGIPYISGTALKGVTLDQALMEKDVFSSPDKRRKAKREDPEIVAAFGAQLFEPDVVRDRFLEDRKGHVIFLDAIPVLNETDTPFDVDIMNPHFQDYYSSEGEAEPADYLSPNPIFFLTVKAGVSFRFAIAARSARFQLKMSNGSPVKVDIPGDKLVETVAGWLKRRLETFGIGAKTRTGLGLFREDKQPVYRSKG